MAGLIHFLSGGLDVALNLQGPPFPGVMTSTPLASVLLLIHTINSAGIFKRNMFRECEAESFSWRGGREVLFRQTLREFCLTVSRTKQNKIVTVFEVHIFSALVFMCRDTDKYLRWAADTVHYIKPQRPTYNQYCTGLINAFSFHLECFMLVNKLRWLGKKTVKLNRPPQIHC